MDGKNWSVDISIDEHDAQTRSTARLHTVESTIVGVGLARGIRSIGTCRRSATSWRRHGLSPTSRTN